jgi:hypothetical protein
MFSELPFRIPEKEVWSNRPDFLKLCCVFELSTILTKFFRPWKSRGLTESRGLGEVAVFFFLDDNFFVLGNEM